jgi:flagellar M-ring protein FliF
MNPQRQAFVMLSAVAMFAAVIGLASLANKSQLTLLYAGMEPGSAGAVIASLEQQGAIYEVRGDAVFVTAENRDELRMTLAGQGLPAQGSEGYEILDALSGFGTTSKMFDAAYWRAKEGELARTIMASPQISSARVHIGQTASNPFQRGVEPTASVSVTSSTETISTAQAQALRFLVAAAIAGLKSENVAIIDHQGRLVTSSNIPVPSQISESHAETLRQRVIRLAEARVGVGNAVVEVSVDTENTSETRHERLFDPKGRVAISTDTEELSDSSKNAASGSVTVASNLPQGDEAAGGGSSRQNSTTRERVNYEVSETQRDILRIAGSVKRITVAVLVNSSSTKLAANGDENLLLDTELASLSALVESAVGFDAERGDIITIRSMPFKPMPSVGSTAPVGLIERLNLNIMSLILTAVLAFVALVLGLFVLRPILTQKPSIASKPNVIPSANILSSDAELIELPKNPDQIKALQDGRNTSQETVDRLRDLIGDKQNESVEILRSWLDEPEEQV